ncbi:hypothetical protein Vadar_026872 [Vaccinium darrowii]|uniref:Uncharacterized protein n=1 Tax=Vaccinium darrowii TaxID=229202 RepID=A0ACB7XU83_9ERIC|nr:hypothetical protein Vadar_026872 [Vaccinium darrowii]
MPIEQAVLFMATTKSTSSNACNKGEERERRSAKKRGYCFVMESSDDEKDSTFENYLPKEMGRNLVSNGTKFVDEVLNDFFKAAETDFPPEVQEDPRFYPYFKDCVGAVDSAAADLQVLNSALMRRNKLQVPEGKFYLVDAKYANIPGFVAPYHGIPYGLHGIPQDAKDLFNHRHSLLRSAADRTFGALKARFPILMTAPPYPLPTQVKLVVAACAIHNYIRGEKRDDLIFRMYEQESELQLEDPMPPLETEQQPLNADAQVLNIPLEEEEVEHALRLRDAIAAEIWNDYIRDFSTTSEQN